MDFNNFEKWILVSESVAFDPDAKYPDPTFGFKIGTVDSGKVSPGGENGNWGGAMTRALWFAYNANLFMEKNYGKKNVVSSQKRTRLLTASGNVSDHFEGVGNAYAVDLACKGEEGDALLAHLMQLFGHPEYKGGSWFNVTKNGYRYQIGWRVKNHFDHIHVGVKKTVGSTIKDKVQTILPGATNSFAKNILANPKFVEWSTTNLQKVPSEAEIDEAVAKPNGKQWFIDTFGVDENGLVKSIKAGQSSTLKIRSSYKDPKKAQNIDLLISEMEKQGITNKYAQVAILSTIGKESGFIPKNEVSYSNTDNSRIRKIFGKRVKDLSDDELTKLKNDDVAFFDKVYGKDATSALGWKTGNDLPGDGYKYRGRGFNQITFKHSYEKYGKAVGLDLVGNPDQLNDVNTAAKAAVAFLKNNLKGMGIDATKPDVFSSKKEAIDKVVQANHGGGSVAGSEGLAKAHEISANFDLA
ncbi:Glycoside hydrolase, family 19, catalytic [uncultured Caudovirales phage]|uniref:Glycoside hydrolase, family 19, catalytic n=1 Tax=uncultured Caudovirales phage TaxID=2100421 RepID=A0A6J5NVV4_9CAUD|nr:Glycoside hydrolase, family 19, catalytic [uncultured Caudovirales phage]